MITSTSHAYRYSETSEILREIRVLVVDDDYLTTASLEMFLSPYIPNLLCLNSPLNASYYLENHHVDLLITDYWMNDLTGVELIKIAKKYNPDICTILLTVEDRLPVAEIVNLGVDRYLKKPAMGTKLLEAIEYAVHRILLKKILIDKQKKEIELMKYKEKYNEYHQKEAYKKQVNILKDDLKDATFLKKFEVGDNIYYFKSFYKPREILSGDCYSIRLIDDRRVFIYLIDTMGKGFSSSITSINSAAILNYLISKYTTRISFPIINKTIKKFLDFIKTILLDEEIVCALFIEIDFRDQKILYSNFSMPPMFLVIDKKLTIIKPNNTPINKNTNDFKIDIIKIDNLEKVFLVSDGIIEAKDRENKIYYHKLIQSIPKTKYMKNFLKKLNDELEEIPDDVTAIFINKVSFDGYFKKTFTINSTLKDINRFIKIFCDRLNRSKRFKNISNKVGVVLSELLLNAHEHGNLGITTDIKDSEIHEESYYEKFIAKLEKTVNKSIKLTIVISLTKKQIYITIEDEGKGFDRTSIETGYYSKYGLDIVNHLTDEFFFNFAGNQCFVLFDLKGKSLVSEAIPLELKTNN
ncbi:MAG: SpoIIE family protein phosphatase [Thermodesulfovibrio sp.]|nr:SpoIIE family protein phosphatase [Thermodesulfovibrio sp.]MDW7997917.1 SpoIIE family protein phosphatase [Thermodesulfovibrio sp.]